MEPNHNNDSNVYKSEKEEKNYFMDILALSGRRQMTQSSRKSFMTELLFENKDSLKPELQLQKNIKEDFDTKSHKSFDQRAYSVKSRCLVKQKQVENEQTKVKNQDSYNQNLLKLKLEEMIFKFKSRIGTLLKEMNITVIELNRFTNLHRIDQILDFLSEKVKELLTNSVINTNIVARQRNKEQQLMHQYEVQLEIMKKKLQEKEQSERNCKERLKASINEARDLLDRFTRKDRQCSTKVTQIYQAKILADQSNKLIESLKKKYDAAEKQCNQLKDLVSSSNKKMLVNAKNIEEQNVELREKIEELQEQIEQHIEKQSKMSQLNQQQNQQIERWRQRFESERLGQKEVDKRNDSYKSNTKSEKLIELKDSAESVNTNQLYLLNQNYRLNLKVRYLEKQVKELNREVHFENSGQKYAELLNDINSEKKEDTSIITELTPFSMKTPVENKIAEVENECNQKIEQNALEWKDKLVQIVDKYEEEKDLLRKEIQNLNTLNEKLEGQVFHLANEKYKVENKLIEKERQIQYYSQPRASLFTSRVANSQSVMTNNDVTTSRDQEFESSIAEIEQKDEEKQKEGEKVDKKQYQN